MAHRKVNSPKHLKNGEFFFETPPQNCMYMLFSHFLHILIIHDVKASENIKFQLSGDILGVYRTPKVGCFFEIVKIHLFCCFITQLEKKVQRWSLYEVIEDILPFVLNIEWPLSDICLLTYEKDCFGCF